MYPSLTVKISVGEEGNNNGRRRQFSGGQRCLSESWSTGWSSSLWGHSHTAGPCGNLLQTHTALRFNPAILLWSHCHMIIPTGDEDLGFTAACEVGRGPFHLTHPHLSANKVGHCGRQSRDETAAKNSALFSVLVCNYWEDKYISTFIPKTTL